MYDAATGRWNGVDALAEISLVETPYAYAGNSPVSYTDVGGLYKYPAGKKAEYEKNYSVLTSFLSGAGIAQYLAAGTEINAALQVFGNWSASDIQSQLVAWNSGVVLQIVDENEILAGDCTGCEINGITFVDKNPQQGNDPSHIKINKRLAEQLQNAKTSQDKKAALFLIMKTIMHESTHYGLRKNLTDSDITIAFPFKRKGGAFYKLSKDAKGEIMKPQAIGTKMSADGQSVIEEGRLLEGALWGNSLISSSYGQSAIDEINRLILDGTINPAYIPDPPPPAPAPRP